jgi:flotillin
VLAGLAKQYQTSGSAGRDVLLMQKLLPLLGRLTQPLSDLRIDRLTVIGPAPAGTASGDGGTPLATKLLGASEQIRAATGLDVPKILKDRFESPAGQAKPASTSPRAASVAPSASVSNQTPPGGFAPSGERGPGHRG